MTFYHESTKGRKHEKDKFSCSRGASAGAARSRFRVFVINKKAFFGRIFEPSRFKGCYLFSSQVIGAADGFREAIAATGF
jgi:hypothetical protein